jgi:hypothetical protein
MLDPPHCLYLLLSRLSSQIISLDPLHCLHFLPCDCACRFSTRRIACTCYLCGCERRCSTRRITCTRFFGGCAHRCLTLRISCTRSWVLVARRCSPRHIACIRFLCSCARRCCQMPSSLHCLQRLKIRRCSHVLDPSHYQLWLFLVVVRALCALFLHSFVACPNYRSLLHTAAFGSRCLPRIRDAFSSPQPPLYLFPRTYYVTLLVLCSLRAQDDGHHVAGRDDREEEISVKAGPC